jgi:undecaprenyl-diphosphatase
MSTIDLQERTMVRLAGLMVIALIPTAAIGLLLHDVVEYFFQSLKSVGSFLLITGIILWITKTITQGKKDIATLTTADAFIIGCAQGLAVAPGISRSGATIACGLVRNLEKETAVRFSFLLSIPAIIGATIVEWKNPSFENTAFLHMILGALTAALTGYIALKILIGMVKKGHLYYFAPYCWVLGGITIILSFMVS